MLKPECKQNVQIHKKCNVDVVHEKTTSSSPPPKPSGPTYHQNVQNETIFASLNINNMIIEHNYGGRVYLTIVRKILEE